MLYRPRLAIGCMGVGLVLAFQFAVFLDYSRGLTGHGWSYRATPPPALGLAEHLLASQEFRSVLTKPFEVVAIEVVTCSQCQGVRWRVIRGWRATREWLREIGCATGLWHMGRMCLWSARFHGGM